MNKLAIQNAIDALKHYAKLLDKEDEASPAIRAIAGLYLLLENIKQNS
jgi:hypothetical protein